MTDPDPGSNHVLGRPRENTLDLLRIYKIEKMIKVYFKKEKSKCPGWQASLVSYQIFKAFSKIFLALCINIFRLE